MELNIFVLVLTAIFAVKSVAILRGQDEEIAKSVSFSWTKPGAMESVAAPQVVVEEQVLAPSEAWAPSLATARLRANRIAVAR